MEGGPLRPEEMVVLARHARSVLAKPASARLFVNGMGLEESVDLTLLDQQGVPTFLFPEGSALLTAAANGRHGTLTLKAVDGTRVVMAGRLSHVSRKVIRAVVNDVVTLAPSGLFVDWMVPGIDVPMQVAVPITYYKYDAHPTFRAVVDRVLTHANDSRHDDLRRFIARRVGTVTGRIAGARLTRLDATGGAVHWVDERGAHTTRFRFPTTAECAHGVSRLLSEELAEHRDRAALSPQVHRSGRARGQE